MIIKLPKQNWFAQYRNSDPFAICFNVVLSQLVTVSKINQISSYKLNCGWSKHSCKKQHKKVSGVVAYNTKFYSKWCSKYLVKALFSSQTNFLCVVCSRKFSLAHQGEDDVKRHVLTITHKRQSFVTLYFVPQNDPYTFKTSRAEVLMINFIVENNLSIAVADKCGPSFRNMSPD